MSEVYVSAAKQRALATQMEKLGVEDADLTERFILGSGAGGQKINKTASCVYLKHTPSGIELKCQRSRSREMNRFLARRELCDRLVEQIAGEKSRRRQAMEKIRRQKRRRSRRQKAKMVELKRQRGAQKQLRGRIGNNGE
ncbi:MAG: peptide chain release factor-like protein [Kiritimatiellia bacterium]|jgi:protein subunit release factor B|nr:peptide chain release factor-like protein [Kiritimatiellia bacterium]MDP6811541.1 peptide chain release factor-like protein [Kiritimatiellia bacterium]MDP7024933.1 peptide chain release factor-like protein [Kiritimatiellia bacterium]